VPTILVVPVNVHECWALDHHWQGEGRTPIGELVHGAKTYGTKWGDRADADRLAACMAWWAAHLAATVPRSQIGQADLVCPVPDNPPKEPYNLPDVLGRAVAMQLHTRYEQRLLTKVRPTAEIKYTIDKAAKVQELAGAFKVGLDVTNKVVVVIDDVVLSGATLETIGALLREAGARRIIAMTATRASKGLSP
jgi:predicted amidophosphoribosyltransferase